MNIDPDWPAYPTNEATCRDGLTKRQELIFRIAAGLASDLSSFGTLNEKASYAMDYADAVLAEMNKEKV